MLLFVAVTTVGCEESAPTTRTILGKVLLDNDPVEGAKVLFIPTRDRDARGFRLPIAFGVTNAKGEFHLKTSDGRNGAALGENDVWIMTRQTAVEATAESGDRPDGPSGGQQPKNRIVREEMIPGQYNRATKLRHNVTLESYEPIVFSLESSND